MTPIDQLLSKPTILVGFLSAGTCPDCSTLVPWCEMLEYGRCEDCWVETILYVEPMPALLTPREAELLSLTVVAPTSVQELQL